MTAILLATVGMGVAVYLCLKILDQVTVGGSSLRAFYEAIGSIVIGVAVYGFMAHLLHVPEVARLSAVVRRLAARG
jgi:hypothetical protein